VAGDEPLRGGARHRGGHVPSRSNGRHAASMKYGGGVRRSGVTFQQTLLVDGDVHRHRSGTHRADHLPRDQARSPLPRHQLPSKREGRLLDRPGDRVGGGQDVRALPPHSRCASESFPRFTSRIVTFAPIAAAIRAALRPVHPAPRTVTFPGGKSSVPGSRKPAPPHPFSSPAHPTWMEKIPATSLIRPKDRPARRRTSRSRTRRAVTRR